MTDYLGAIVDSISDNPAILFDLDDNEVFYCSDFTWSPPTLRRSMVSSLMVHGERLAASAYGDREVSFTVTAKVGAAAEDQAQRMSRLIRLLSDPRGQWLMHHLPGMEHPVFFRTKPADFDVLEELLTDSPIRSVTVTLPADPFVYGPRVTLPTVTVSNDPTASSTNPMSFAVGDVMGDAPTPLHLRLESATGLSSLLVGATAGSSTPRPLGTAGALLPASGYTIETVSNVFAVGGSFRRATRASGGSPTDLPVIEQTLPAVFGEYRVFVRARTSATNVSMRVVAPASPRASVGGTWRWLDLGTWRLPARSPVKSPFSDGFTPSGTAVLTIAATGSIVEGDTFDVDHVLAIPAPGPDGNRGSMLLATRDEDAGSTTNLTLDGPNDAVYFLSELGEATTGEWAVGGGYPSLSPGVSNRVYVAGWIGASLATDDPASTITATPSYFPRYLYLRPAVEPSS